MHFVNSTSLYWVRSHANVNWFSNHTHGDWILSRIFLDNLIFVVMESLYQVSAIHWSFCQVLLLGWRVFCSLRFPLSRAKWILVLIRAHFYDIELFPKLWLNRELMTCCLRSRWHHFTSSNSLKDVILTLLKINLTGMNSYIFNHTQEINISMLGNLCLMVNFLAQYFHSAFK